MYNQCRRGGGCFLRGDHIHRLTLQPCDETICVVNADVVVGISAAVIVMVFCLQGLGSRRIGFLYSPILILWFLVNASIGVYNIVKWQPDVFKVGLWS